MNEKNWHQVKEIFLAALAKEPASRAKFLDENCADNSDLREEIESMLASHEEIEDFIETPAFQVGEIFANGSNHKEKQVEATSTLSVNPKFKIQNSKLRGDLDNIILMALRKEPMRRYASVANFSDDIAKYLSGLPVSARPNTFKYRASKFINRHKVGVLAASLIFLSLVGGIITTTWQARVARREKVKAETVNTFLQTMLNYSDNSVNISRPTGQEMTVKDVLNIASARLETEDLTNQPEVKAKLQQIIGTSYLSQGEYDLAERNLRSALELENQIYGENSNESLETLVDLAQVFLTKTDYSSAEKIYLQRLTILRREQQKGTINPTYLLVALNDFALLRRAQGNSIEAETLLREGLALKPQIPTENRMAVGIAEAVFALILSDQGKFEEAEKIVRERIVEIRQQSNGQTTELAVNLNALGGFLMEKGELAESQKNLLEAEAIYRKLLNPLSLPLGDNLRFQAQVLYLQGNYVEAEKKINETIKIYESSSNSKYINYPMALTIQGLILQKLGKALDAENLLREAVKIRSESLPKEHFWVALAKSALGEFLTDRKRFAEAEPLLRESYESLKISQGENNPRTILARSRVENLVQTSKK